MSISLEWQEKAVTRTPRNPAPSSFLYFPGSFTTSGTKPGRRLAIECPVAAAILNPSPVEPVCGCEAPPVATMTVVDGKSPSLVRTPQTFPLSTIKPITFVLGRTSTPPRARWSSSARTTSCELPEAGYILPEALVLNVIPYLAKNSRSSPLKKRLKEGSRKRPLAPNWAMKSSLSLVFVKLQRPFPVMSTFFPGRSIFSRRRTRVPSSAARPAAIMPPAPAPMMIICLLHAMLEL